MCMSNDYNVNTDSNLDIIECPQKYCISGNSNKVVGNIFVLRYDDIQFWIKETVMLFMSVEFTTIGSMHQVSLSMWLRENNQNLDIGNEQVSTLENEHTTDLSIGNGEMSEDKEDDVLDLNVSDSGLLYVIFI